MFRYSRSKVLFYYFGLSLSIEVPKQLDESAHSPPLNLLEHHLWKSTVPCWFLKSSSGWKGTISSGRGGWNADFWDYPLGEKELFLAGGIAGPMANTQALPGGGSLSEGNRCSKCNIWEGVSSNIRISTDAAMFKLLILFFGIYECEFFF